MKTKIAELRKEQKLSQEELALAVGVGILAHAGL